MANFGIDYNELDSLVDLMKEAENSEDVVNDVLHGFAAEEIKQGIQPLIPVSGRHWNGKKTAASSTKPFTQTNENLSVIVKTRPMYNYLYFPDDGSNTKHHAGNQQFMYRGAESKQDSIIEKITQQLIEQIEGGN